MGKEILSNKDYDKIKALAFLLSQKEAITEFDLVEWFLFSHYLTDFLQ